MEKVEVAVIGKSYQGRAVGESFKVSRRDARVLVAIGKVSAPEGYLRRDMVPGPGGAAQAPEDSQLISAAVRKAAEDAGLVVESIFGTGKDGRVTKSDVDAAIELAGKQQE
ncbi:E3 binding domain-containing protein [Pseudomonas sp. G.S.17]|uniref:E3 binding domain-containing protein n=1 Tax=Pseudomonas sp. G.S.17 TaxID=3137451 RepID=UPI00311CCA66